MEPTKKDVRVVGEKIYLRPITMEDTDLVVKWRNDEKVVRNFIYRKPISREEHIGWMEQKVATGRVIQFIVCDKQTDKPLGVVYIQNIEEEHSKAEEGIFLGEEEAFGRGIGTEAAKLMIRYAFETLGLHKLSARVLAYNTASCKMHESAGYRQEAYFRKELFLDGKYEDLIFYGILHDEV
ncbi:MAG: UDP-4-amino-4,6-dideoxy-N-acetyl-beta-L-altrosamine N-acetyltransferase [Lachnospiraceae bacterium]|nr:UDP-4-amino-4,6-dideoxy-N-acetyl-beta-L-altrosamine N-acetyltransferase [Lachnospiraceae bacterium]